VTNRSIRLACASLCLALVLPACTPPAGSSPTVPASVRTAAASLADAFCAVDLETNADVQAAVDAADEAATGGQVDMATVGPQIDAAVTELEAQTVSGEAMTVRDALVSALEAFRANPNQATGTALAAAFRAATDLQAQACA
jgi:hypothetical protein